VPGFWDDPEAAQKVIQEKAGLEAIVGKYEKLFRETRDLRELLEMAEGDQGVIAEVCAQIPELERRTRQLEVARMLSGEEDRADAIVSIHPGTGGVDAQEWAEVLFRMYLRWCDKKGFKVEIIDRQPGEQAGIKAATFHVRGPYAYGYLRAENGVHRLIRISPFDANARRQTSFASVEVVPDLDDDIGEIAIKPEDLRVETFRAGGKGGQHVNKTESAVRITHLPTGLVVACQAERSQHQNRATAMKMLRGKLYELERQRREREFQENFGVEKMEIGFGSQVRTYTLHPYRLVKDERTDLKLADVDAVLDGDLDELIEAYLMKTADQRKRKKERDATWTL